jgi:hypothetical protein
MTAAFVALVAAVAVHLVIVVLAEPFAFDAWNIEADTRGEPFSLDAWARYVWSQYTGGNPRLGQAFAYLGYKVEWTTAVLTPIAWLAFVTGIVSLGLARRPSLRSTSDLALLTFALGVAWLVLPFPGTIVFTRAYAANYLYSAAFQIWFLHVVRRYDAPWVVAARPWQCVVFALAGVLAGAANQHTGPMLFIVTAGVAWHLWRRRQERRWLLIAGAIGLAIGYAVLFFAPGNSVHYDNLAGEASLSQRVVSRGIGYNAYILREYLVAAAPVLVATLLALLAARPDRELGAARRGVLIALGCGVIIVVTLFASPKLGPRFFFFPLALLLAAFVHLVDAIRPGRRALIGLAALGVFASGYIAFSSITLYRRLHRQSEVRLAELRAAKPGESVVVTPWEIVDMHWLFWGDDFKDPRKRRLVQDYFKTGPIEWFGPARTAPLGVAGIGFWIELEPPGVDQATFQPASWEVDIPLLTRQLEHAVARARTRTAGLTAAELRVRLPRTPAGLPDRPLVVARWTPHDGIEAFPPAVRHASADGTTRAAMIPVPLLRAEWFVWPVGLAARPAVRSVDAELTFELAPGRTHWLIACLPERCVVTAVVR